MSQVKTVKIILDSDEYVVLNVKFSDEFKAYCDGYITERFGESFLKSYTRKEEFAEGVYLKLMAIDILSCVKTSYFADFGFNTVMDRDDLDEIEIKTLFKNDDCKYASIEEVWAFVPELDEIKVLEINPTKRELTREAL